MSSHVKKRFLKNTPKGELANVSADEWTSWQWQVQSSSSSEGTPYYHNLMGSQGSQLLSAYKLVSDENSSVLTLSDSEWLKKIDEENLNKPVINFSLPRLSQLPQRITPELAQELGSRNQIIIHLFINHPKECSLELFEACERLANVGVILNNHMTFFKGINDNPEVVKELNLKLIMMRVRPYSIYLKEYLSAQNEILKVSEDQAIAILESLRGWTSGLAVPHLLVETKEGVYEAKLPNYIKENSGEHFVFRNYKNMEFEYINK